MQNKVLNNKLFRPTEASNATSKTSQSTSSQSKSPLAEENHFITINNSINNSTPPLPNRSCLQLRLLNQTSPGVCYSSFNAKLEDLETKLRGKIMAINSYFIDELRSLEQEAPVTKKWITTRTKQLS